MSEARPTYSEAAIEEWKTRSKTGRVTGSCVKHESKSDYDYD
jgi:hypothetical protein